MQTVVNEEQKEILDAMAGKNPEAPVVDVVVVEDDGVRRYVASPGYSIVKAPDFPCEIEDKEMQAYIEKSRGFKHGKVWIEKRNKAECEVIEKALGGFSVVKLRKMVGALGYTTVNQYKKYELLDILMKEGF
jgi:hypothetical protein